jgi:hypothetical protein
MALYKQAELPKKEAKVSGFTGFQPDSDENPSELLKKEADQDGVAQLIGNTTAMWHAWQKANGKNTAA